MLLWYSTWHTSKHTDAHEQTSTNTSSHICAMQVGFGSQTHNTSRTCYLFAGCEISNNRSVTIWLFCIIASFQVKSSHLFAFGPWSTVAKAPFIHSIAHFLTISAVWRMSSKVQQHPDRQLREKRVRFCDFTWGSKHFDFQRLSNDFFYWKLSLYRSVCLSPVIHSV